MNVENVFEKIRTILDSAEFGSWDTDRVGTLTSFISRYHELQRPCRLRCTSRTNPSEKSCTDVSEENSRNVGGCEGEIGEEIVILEMDRLLTQLRRYLQQHVPYGSLPEPSAPPSTTCDSRKVGVAMGSSTVTAVNSVAPPVFPVDSFLYLEEDIDELVERGCVSREYCRRCGSTDIALCDFITHSFSHDQLLFISCYLLPALGNCSYRVTSDRSLCPREGKQSLDDAAPFSCRLVADVGSRLGAVLLSCYFAAQQGRLPMVAKVTGIEVEKGFVDLQQKAINYFASKPTTLRLDVVHSDCFRDNGLEVLSNADVLILHNVFEYFSDGPVSHLRSWRRLREAVQRPGRVLICSPSLEETFATFSEEHWRNVFGCELEGFDHNNTHLTSTNPPYDYPHRKRSRGCDECDCKDGKKESRFCDGWLTAWVEEIDVSFVRRAFLSVRETGVDVPEKYSDCSEEACELIERLENIKVYRVK
uniref:Methyltransferase type 11 domain-containing protein n=1 Tax=Trypanosoma vivax (strain Y486) TaxID=1055687 RepID=G0U4S7_TRYVY|nr:conserved hypothetical protein [Trypanosoma vivax Y486]